MGKALIIVESPTKIKTLKKFLGKDYIVESSVGHIRDLPSKGFGIDFENNFEPTYEIMADKKDVIAKLKKAAKSCDVVYLAPDPDREGEAIAWHISSILPKDTKCKRVTFNAITKDVVLEALKKPRKIDQALVDAQQARRLLDRIVGYKISPILQRRIKRGGKGGMSAGRVQSIALKFVVDREKEILAFVPMEYWNLTAKLSPGKGDFEAALFARHGLKLDKEPQKKGCFNIQDEALATRIEKELKEAKYRVSSVEKKEKKRNPVPPFITSTLQQEASRHYGFGAQRTMNIAQSLYEGVDLGTNGTEGLITYMRTDSVRVEPEAIDLCRQYIEKEYGNKYLPKEPKRYATKKSAQDAHEAIRPTNIFHPPDLIKEHLTIDQYKLYKLIWHRFVASQMNPAVYDTVSIEIKTDNDILLRATGSQIKFKGFLALYEEKQDKESEANKNMNLPDLEEGDELKLLSTEKTQSFTKPPPRFTEASLVKELEKSGIGRPSTYAAIMNKIHSRDYTTKERLTIKPTELGMIIAKFLEDHFQIIMNTSFTARMEDDLDEIASSEREWREFLKEFWDKFVPIIEVAEKEAFVPKIETDLECPQCKSKLQKIWARGKYFYGCSRYPECDFATPIEALHFDKSEYAPDFDWDQKCPKCGEPMKLRHGRFGAFLGCTKYPDCRGIVNIPHKDDPKLEDLPKCPAIGCDGHIKERRSNYGKSFFSCSNYPDCDVIVNNLDDLEKKYVNHKKTAYVKKKGAGGRGKKKLSKPLAEVCGEDKLTRGDITKKLWAYIKEHDLQDPNNRRLIVPDKKLEKVFGSKEPLDMMKLAGVISKNLE